MKLKNLLIGLLTMAMVTMSVPANSAERQAVVLTDSNTIVLNGEVDEQMVGTVMLQARTLDAKLSASVCERYLRCAKEHLHLFLYTPGGSIQKGFELIDALKGLGRPVDTVVMFAASMGFQITQNLGERDVLENGTLMSHQALGQVEGYFGPQVNQMRSRYDYWLKRVNDLDRIVVARTGGKQTLESYQKAYDHELWVSGVDAVQQGYADKVVSARCDKTLLGVESHELSFMGARVTYDLDKCPLNTSPMNIRIEVPTSKGFKLFKTFVNEGGSFDPGCKYSGNKDALCIEDTSLTVEKINQIEGKFLDKLDYRNHIVPMTF